MKKVPKHISEQYHNGAHGFRSEKRKAIRLLCRVIDDLRLGCAYYPNGTTRVEDLGRIAKELKQELSVKNWGR